MIGIIGAMDVEIDEIKSRVENKTIKTVSGRAFVVGQLNGRDVVVAQCGIGKVNAALCAEAMILTYNPDLVINVGVGGSLNAALKYGDIAIADKLVQHDVDTSALGDPVGLVSTVNKVYFECDAHTVQCIRAVVNEMDGVRGMTGPIASEPRSIPAPSGIV